MQTDTEPAVPTVTRAAFALAVLLAAIAVYNYATGVRGGAVVSSLGATVATVLGLLSGQ